MKDKKILKIFVVVLEIIVAPVFMICALPLKWYRRLGSQRFVILTWILKRVGVFPIINHYYEPLFDDRLLGNALTEQRRLPGIDLRVDYQLQLCTKMNYGNDFLDFLSEQKFLSDSNSKRFSIRNGSFESGDADFLFSFMRYHKPSKVIEIGCGVSTLLIQGALTLNQKETGQTAEHICIEPYHQPWLEGVDGIKLVRQKVEDVPISTFSGLSSGDLLFIDSTHIIRPQGDVLFQLLEVLPSLANGVFIHVHDIFTPYDYLDSWVKKNVKLWNEQYVLEALLSGGARYSVIAALHYLNRNHSDDLAQVCPTLSEESCPGSFYLQVNS